MQGGIRAVLFDFGGVIADEGFREGIKEAARREGLDPDHLFAMAETLIYESGYLTGDSGEAEFWSELRRRSGLKAGDGELRALVIGGFRLRPGMLRLASALRQAGISTGILSDQTDWLDEIDAKTPFKDRFDNVFNSYRLHKSKRDSSVFTDACSAMGLRPAEVLFVDDKEENVRRAEGAGLEAVLFRDVANLEAMVFGRLGLSAAKGKEHQ